MSVHIFQTNKTVYYFSCEHCNAIKCSSVPRLAWVTKADSEAFARNALIRFSGAHIFALAFN